MLNTLYIGYKSIKKLLYINSTASSKRKLDKSTNKLNIGYAIIRFLKICEKLNPIKIPNNDIPKTFIKRLTKIWYMNSWYCMSKDKKAPILNALHIKVKATPHNGVKIRRPK